MLPVFRQLTFRSGANPLSNWVEKAATPKQGGYGEAVVGTGDAIYVARCMDVSSEPEFWRYDPSTNTWSNMPTDGLLTGAFRNGACLAFTTFTDGGIYALMGGRYSDTNRTLFYRFDIYDEVWQPLANTPHAQGAGDALVYCGYDGNLYAFLGSREHGSVFAHYFLDNNTWQILPSIWNKTDDGCSLTWAGTTPQYIYALQGEVDETIPNTNFARFNIVTKEWEELAPIPETNGVGDGASLIWVSDYRIFALGGGGADESPGYNFYCYYINNNTWQKLDDIPYPVGYYVGNRLAYANNSIYYWQGAPSTWEGGNRFCQYPLEEKAKSLSMYLTPQQSIIHFNETFTVDVIINVTEVYTAQCWICFNSTLLEAVSVENGNIFTTFDGGIIDNNAGIISDITGFSITPIDASGGKVFATITFQAKEKVGISSIELLSDYAIINDTYVPTYNATVEVRNYPVYVSIEPAYNLIGNETAVFDVTVDPNGNELSIMTFDITFDPNYFQVTGVTDGGLFSTLTPDIDNVAGVVSIFAIQTPIPPGVTNAGTLATIEFTPLQTAVTDINITNIGIFDVDGEHLYSIIQNATLEAEITSPVSIKIFPENLYISLNSSATFSVVLDKSPNGLAGYNITLYRPSVWIWNETLLASLFSIENISFPSWASLHDWGFIGLIIPFPVWFKAVDLNDQIKANATDITLATVEIKANEIGSGNITLSVNRLDDDEGYLIEVITKDCKVTVFPKIGEKPSTDPDTDGLYEDINGNGLIDFDDVVEYFQHFEWVEENWPVEIVDFNGNGLVDFDDVVELFKEV